MAALFPAQIQDQRGKHVKGIGPVFAGWVDSTPPTPPYTDFWIITRPSPDDPDTTQWAVMYGYMGYGDAPDDPISIDGTPDDYPTDPSELQWNDWDGAEGSVWFEGTVDVSQATVQDAISYLQINADSMGGSFDPTEQPWTDADACLFGYPDSTVTFQTDQSAFKYLLAKFTLDDNGNLQIEMRVRGPLAIFGGPVLGNFCFYPGPPLI